VALRLAVDDFDGGRPLPLPRCLTGAALECGLAQPFDYKSILET
jgi:hypothetical protein